MRKNVNLQLKDKQHSDKTDSSVKGQSASLSVPSDYVELLESLRKQIRLARLKAGLAVNRELILLYWQIGREILSRQTAEGWGAKVIDRLAQDLRTAFPEMKGFSPRNLKYMRAFAEAHSDGEFVQAVLAQITWYHNITLLDKVKDPGERMWYIRQTIDNGWSRNILVMQIESDLYGRQGKAVNNFAQTLPPMQSDLAQQLLKDPYCFDFLTVSEKAQERELEQKLLDRLKDFLLELGKGFALVGSQYHLEVGGEDFYMDLLFYHLRLRCYVIIELKMGKFVPEYAGKMNFYLSAVDDLLRHPSDQPSIGLILCKSRNHIIAEYALRDMSKPMGVSTFRVRETLPEDLQENLPTLKQLEEQLGRQDEDLSDTNES